MGFLGRSTIAGLLLLTGCTTSSPAPTITPLHNRSSTRLDLTETVPAGRSTRLDFWLGLTPACAPTADDAVVLSGPPLHGTATIRVAPVHPDYPPNNPRHRCDDTPHPALDLIYTPFPGYAGPDAVSVTAITPSGERRETHWTLAVDRSDAAPRP